jgi:hypothetical protein
MQPQRNPNTTLSLSLSLFLSLMDGPKMKHMRKYCHQKSIIIKKSTT